MQNGSVRLTNYLWVVGFIACVVAFFALGNIAGVRVVGIVVIGGALRTLITRSVPVGIRGRAPFFYITGPTAVIVGLIMALMGVLLVVYPQEVVNLMVSSHRHWQS